VFCARHAARALCKRFIKRLAGGFFAVPRKAIPLPERSAGLAPVAPAAALPGAARAHF